MPKNPIFQENEKTSPIFFEKNLDKKIFFSPWNIKYFANFMRTFFEKIFWRNSCFFFWTKKIFFNVNPYQFSNTMRDYTEKKNLFFQRVLANFLWKIFFFPKKKKKNFFFFRAPKFLKNPAKNLPSDQRITTSQAFSISLQNLLTKFF